MTIQDAPNDKYLLISKLKHSIFVSDQPIHDISYLLQANNCICNITEKVTFFHPGFCPCYPGFMFKTGTYHVQGPSLEVDFIHRKPMAPKKAPPDYQTFLRLCRMYERSTTGCKSIFRKIFELKIWKKPMLVLKQMIHQKKALDLSFNLTP